MEADADRNDQAHQPGILVHPYQSGDRTAGKVCVFKRAQEREVGGDPGGQCRFPPARRQRFEPDRDRVIRNGENEKEDDVPRVPASVEVVACNEQHGAAPACRDAVEYGRNHHEENPELVRLERQRYADSQERSQRRQHAHMLSNRGYSNVGRGRGTSLRRKCVQRTLDVAPELHAEGSASARVEMVVIGKQAGPFQRQIRRRRQQPGHSVAGKLL